MYDEYIERTVLYYAIFEKEEMILSEEDFFNIKNKKIYKAIKELEDKKEEVNIISIKNKINEEDAKILEYISEIAQSRYGSSLEYAYKKLKEFSKKRKLLSINKKIQEELKENNIDDIEIFIEKQIKELKEINEDEQTEETFQDIVSKTSDIITQKYLQKDNYENKFTTGIFDLDKVTNGLHEEELTIIGARPAVGKTAFALKIAENIAKKGIKIAIISLEMSKTQLVERLIAKEARVDSSKIRTGTLTEQEIQEIAEATARVYELPIFINTKIKNIQEIEIYIRKLKNKEDIRLINNRLYTTFKKSK